MRTLRSSLLLFLSMTALAQHPHRDTLSLNGTWQVEDSIEATATPRAYTHTAPVPGLTHSATPAFADVDQFQSRELLSNLSRKGMYPKADYDKLGNSKGITHQQRNYFWYRKTFHAPTQRASAILRIGKAQFGAAAFVNGIPVGDHAPCFTAATFDVTRAIHWNADNEVVIRIGAHPGVLPENVMAGTDFEKNRWTPGIYDDVTLLAADNPIVTNIQAAPQLATGSVLIATELRNTSAQAITTTVRQQVRERLSNHTASAILTTHVTLASGETKTIQQTVPITHPHLWTPDDPFLYTVQTTTDGDQTDTRFGMRDFHFDTATRRAMLNGKPYFLRGSNITLHRFFEDPDVGTLPWDEAWLQRLLVTIPKGMHWNSFRFCIGPVPDRWLQIADENGLLIQNEYPVWTGKRWGYEPHYDEAEMTIEYREWMRDNWNHPSVAIWDASNESWLPGFSERVIPAVRVLDLSNRPWEDSYNAPAGPDDPVEDHQYLLQKLSTATDADVASGKVFTMPDTEALLGPTPNNSTYPSGHAAILNEYGWLWLNRDGSPTLLTDKLYPRLMQGKPDTAAARFAMQAYLLAGETEFWRSTRHYAAILHFVYLSSSDPHQFTSDHFVNVKTLQLEPNFAARMEQAMRPLGVYLNFWQPRLPPAAMHDFAVSLTNDDDRPHTGTLRLVFRNAAGSESSTATERAVHVEPLGARSFTFTVATPSQPGGYAVDAIFTANEPGATPTISHRENHHHPQVSLGASRWQGLLLISMRMLLLTVVSAATVLGASAQSTNLATGKVRNDPGFHTAAETHFRAYEAALTTHCPTVAVDWAHAVDKIYGTPVVTTKGGIINATWVDTVPGNACGEARRYRVLVAIRGGHASVAPLLPGDSFASPQLEQDAVRPLADATASFFPKGQKCAVDVLDTALDGPAPAQSKEPWNEVWTVRACNRKLSVPLRFVPDVVGEGTAIRIDSKTVTVAP